MTLDVSKLLVNLIAKEAKVSHFSCQTYGGKASSLKAAIREEARSAYGESYLNDADYVIFFKGDSIDGTAESQEKLFKLVDRALGETANKLAKADLDELREPDGDDGQPGKLKCLFLKVTLK